MPDLIFHAADTVLLVAILVCLLRVWPEQGESAPPQPRAPEAEKVDISLHHHQPPVEEVQRYAIIRKEAAGGWSIVAHRTGAHSDIQAAIDEPGLGVLFPDGSIDWGRER